MESLKAYLACFPDYPGYVKVATTDPFGNPVVQYVQVGTIFYRMETYLAVVPPAPPAVMEHPAQENGPTDEEQKAGDAFVAHVEARSRAEGIVDEFDGDLTLQPVEIGIINTLKEALATDNVEKLKEALQDWDVLCEHDEDEDRVDEELQHVAELLQEDKNVADEADKEKAKELFVDANRKFQIQRNLFKTKGRCEELHAAQVAYIKTRDELSAVMAKINDPRFTLRALADERWPDDDHADFEEKLDQIYNFITFKISEYSAPKAKKVYKPVAAEKRAPAPSTLDQMVMRHISGAKKGLP